MRGNVNQKTFSGAAGNFLGWGVFLRRFFSVVELAKHESVKMLKMVKNLVFDMMYILSDTPIIMGRASPNRRSGKHVETEHFDWLIR